MSRQSKLTFAKDYGILLCVASVVFILDQISKFWIDVNPNLPLNSYWPEGGYEIIPGFLYISHVGNPGAAWGMFAGASVWLALLALVALGLIYRFRDELCLKDRYMQWAFGLLCGGIIGNLVDRLIHGYVIDFIDVHLPGYRWPSFNIADAGISIGVGMYVLFTIKEIIRERKEYKAKASEAGEDPPNLP